MIRLKTTKITNKNKRKLEKSLKKLPCGENFIQDSMTKMEIIFNVLYKLRLTKSVLLKRHLMIICFKLGMVKSMDSTLMKKLTVKLENLEPLSETKRKRKLEANDFYRYSFIFFNDNILAKQFSNSFISFYKSI